MKITDDDAAAFGPSGTALLGRRTAHLVLDTIELR